MRTAEEIGRTAAGARRCPRCCRAPRARCRSSAAPCWTNGLTVVAARKPRSPLIEVRLRVPFGGTTRCTRRGPSSSRDPAAGHRPARPPGRRRRAGRGGRPSGHRGRPARLLVTGSVLASGLPTLLDVLADCLTAAAYRKDDVWASGPGWSNT